MGTMKLFGFVVAVFLTFDSSQGNTLDQSEKCKKMIDLASRALAKYRQIAPATNRATEEKMLLDQVGIDVNNRTALDTLLCKVADATTLRDLYDAMPKKVKKLGNYAWFKSMYDSVPHDVASSLGGYTNAERLAQTFLDMTKWGDQLKPGLTLREKTDLATLTDYLNFMQVKYGSRWMSVFLGSEHQSFSIEDPEALAKKLYESDSDGPIAEFTGLPKYQASYLLYLMKGNTDGLLYKWLIPMVPIVAEAVNLAGDLGLFNLH